MDELFMRAIALPDLHFLPHVGREKFCQLDDLLFPLPYPRPAPHRALDEPIEGRLLSVDGVDVEGLKDIFLLRPCVARPDEIEQGLGDLDRKAQWNERLVPDLGDKAVPDRPPILFIRLQHPLRLISPGIR